MDSELFKEWEKLSLTEEKEEGIIVGDGEDVDEGDGVKDQINLVLAGKLWTVRTFSPEVMKKTLMAIWRLNDNLSISSIDTNLFICQFFREEDKQRILDGRPWFFDGKLLLLKEVNGGEQPSDIEFYNSPMWIRLMDVPLNKRNPSSLYDIGEALGGYIDHDSLNVLGWGEYVRLKIMVDARKPLRRGFFISVGGQGKKWVEIKYERLGEFCFYCGKLNHTDKECRVKEEEEERKSTMVYQYGTWLRASPCKRGQKSFAEREVERNWSEKLIALKDDRTVESKTLNKFD